MTSSSAHHPAAARALAQALTDVVDAARTGDPDLFDAAAGRLAGLDAEQVRVLLGAVIRSLLEGLHPDGLSGDDIHLVLDRCARDAGAWCPEVDPSMMLVVLAGALGVHDDEPDRLVLGPLDVARQAPLIIADLLGRVDLLEGGDLLDGGDLLTGTASQDGGALRGGTGGSLAEYVDAALAEIARAECEEMP